MILTLTTVENRINNDFQISITGKPEAVQSMSELIGGEHIVCENEKNWAIKFTRCLTYGVQQWGGLKVAENTENGRVWSW